MAREAVAAQAILVVGCWGVAGYKCWHCAREPGNPSLLSMAMAATALATGITLQLFAAEVDLWTGLPNTGRLVSNCAMATSIGATSAFLMYLSRPEDEAARLARRRWWLLAAILPAMVVLFLLTPVDQASSRADPRHDTAVYSSPYVYLFLGYMAQALVGALLEARRCLRIIEERVVRVAFRLGVAGCLSGLGFVAFKYLYLIGHDLHVPVPGREVVTATPLYVVTIALMTAAVAVPAVRPVLADLRRLLRRYRSYQRLRPLWLAVYQATPEIALNPRVSRLRNWLTVRDLDFLLYRRVIEIRDGQLALRPWSTDQGGSLDEAAALAAALAARNAGQPGDPGTRPDPPTGGADLATEIASLERLATAFAIERRRRRTARTAAAPSRRPRPHRSVF